MGMAIRERTETTLSEINVTPLVDVMLVLLIIFMITAPMLSASIDVNLAEASRELPDEAKEHLVLSITAEGRVYVADTRTELEFLPTRVREELARTGIRDVAIRGDKEVAYGRVLEVVDRLRAAEIESVGLVMDPPSRREETR